MSDVRKRVKDSLDRMRDVAALSAGAGMLACSGAGNPVIDPGYGVVDPMPSPARCDEPFAGRIWPSASWLDKNGKFVLMVDVDLQWSLDASGSISSAPKVEGGKLASMPQTPARRLTLEIIPDTGATELYLTLPIRCPPVESESKFRFDLKGPLANGQSLYGQYVPPAEPTQAPAPRSPVQE